MIESHNPKKGEKLTSRMWVVEDQCSCARIKFSSTVRTPASQCTLGYRILFSNWYNMYLYGKHSMIFSRVRSEAGYAPSVREILPVIESSLSPNYGPRVRKRTPLLCTWEGPSCSFVVRLLQIRVFMQSSNCLGFNWL